MAGLNHQVHDAHCPERVATVRNTSAGFVSCINFRPTNAPFPRVFSFRINYYTGLQEDLMDGTKQKEDQSDPKKPVSEQITDLVAAAAGALLKQPSSQLPSACVKPLPRKRPNR
jgi:hypothetical protein